MDSDAVRVFYAIVPPADVAASLAELAKGIGQRVRARAVRAENIHMTLAFVGAWPLSGMPSLKVAAEVRNSGARAGDEVVEVYLDAPDPQAPRHALVGFRRVHLESGESRRTEFKLAPRQLSTVDAAGHRAVVAGRYRVFIGGGQPGDAPGVGATFTITGREALPR